MSRDLPQVLTVQIPAPNLHERLNFINDFVERAEPQPKFWSSPAQRAALTAGLSLHAVRQLLAGAAYADSELQPNDLIHKVEEFIQAQVGEDVVEFKKPSHTLERSRRLCAAEGVPRPRTYPSLQADPDKALPGAAVAGPIGGGKTFIFRGGGG